MKLFQGKSFFAKKPTLTDKEPDMEFEEESASAAAGSDA